jgi:hypothetical protein
MQAQAEEYTCLHCHTENCVKHCRATMSGKHAPNWRQCAVANGEESVRALFYCRNCGHEGEAPIGEIVWK